MEGSSSSNFAHYHSPHKAKKHQEKKKKVEKTFRFDIDLSTCDDSGNRNYEFNWLDLMAEEHKHRHGDKGACHRPVGPLDPYASDDEDQLKALARQFEAKYGGAEDIRKKKKKQKLDDYADLGYGYDSNDPFIDNSDVHDEIVPGNLTTVHGGFYVNVGPLEFKARESADEDSDMEAVIKEGEKAATKRKYKKLKEEKEKKTTSVENRPPPKKKNKLEGGAPLTVEVASSSSSLNGDAQKPKKPRIRKEGAKPLGRPKKRNPDGSLVHPPKLPKVKKPVLLGSGMSTHQRQQQEVRQQQQSQQPSQPSVIAVKKTKGARQVVAVSTPGAPKQPAVGNGSSHGKSNVVDITAAASSSILSNKPSSLTIRKKPKDSAVKPPLLTEAKSTPSVSVTMTKVKELNTGSSNNSSAVTVTSSSEQLVRDAEVRMLANTVDAMLRGIPPPSAMAAAAAAAASKTAKTLAGGATISPATLSSSSTPRTNSSKTTTASVSVTAASSTVSSSSSSSKTSSKAMTVKQQLNAVRKQQQHQQQQSSSSNGATKPSAVTKPVVQMPKHDLGALVEQYLHHEASPQVTASAQQQQSEKASLSKNESVPSPTLSSSRPSSSTSSVAKEECVKQQQQSMMKKKQPVTTHASSARTWQTPTTSVSMTVSVTSASALPTTVTSSTTNASNLAATMALFNMQGAENIQQLQNLLLQSSGFPGIQDDLYKLAGELTIPQQQPKQQQLKRSSTPSQMPKQSDVNSQPSSKISSDQKPKQSLLKPFQSSSSSSPSSSQSLTTTPAKVTTTPGRPEQSQHSRIPANMSIQSLSKPSGASKPETTLPSAQNILPPGISLESTRHTNNHDYAMSPARQEAADLSKKTFAQSSPTQQSTFSKTTLTSQQQPTPAAQSISKQLQQQQQTGPNYARSPSVQHSMSSMKSQTQQQAGSNISKTLHSTTSPSGINSSKPSVVVSPQAEKARLPGCLSVENLTSSSMINTTSRGLPSGSLAMENLIKQTSTPSAVKKVSPTPSTSVNGYTLASSFGAVSTAAVQGRQGCYSTGTSGPSSQKVTTSPVVVHKSKVAVSSPQHQHRSSIPQTDNGSHTISQQQRVLPVQMQQQQIQIQKQQQQRIHMQKQQQQQIQKKLQVVSPQSILQRQNPLPLQGGNLQQQVTVSQSSSSSKMTSPHHLSPSSLQTYYQQQQQHLTSHNLDLLNRSSYSLHPQPSPSLQHQPQIKLASTSSQQQILVSSFHQTGDLLPQQPSFSQSSGSQQLQRSMPNMSAIEKSAQQQLSTTGYFTSQHK